MSDAGGRQRLYRADAVVLRRRDLGEADRILTIYTREHGKLRVVAKGVRRTKSRLAGHLEPLSRTALVIAQGRNLDIVTQAALVQPFKHLHETESGIAFAGYFADLLDALTADGETHPAVYELLLQSLARLDDGRDLQLTAAFYEAGLLRLLGFQPELQRCVACGEPLQAVAQFFSPQGGALCPNCVATDPQAAPLSVNGLKLLRLLDRGEVETLDRLRVGDQLRAEVEGHLRAALRQVLERELGSLSVLKTLAT